MGEISMSEDSDRLRTQSLARDLARKIERIVARSGRVMRFDPKAGRYVLTPANLSSLADSSHQEGDGE